VAVKKYYVIWQGRETGIFTDWNSCKKQIDKFAGARYKSFKTLAEAEAAFSSGSARSGASKTAAGGAAKKRSSNRQTVKTYTAVEIAAMKIDTTIFTDGGCEPNPGKAGSGIALYRKHQLDELWYGLFNPTCTNNTGELNALHQALMMAGNEISRGKSVAILCDSKYSIQCITQ